MQAENTKYDLESIATHFGIEIQERHTALGDALATAMILQRILAWQEKTGRGSEIAKIFG